MNNTPISERTFNITFGTIVKILAVLFAAYILYLVRDIALLVITAVVLASAIDPATDWFTRHKIPRTLAVIIIYLIALIVVAGIVYLFVPRFVAELSLLLQNIPSQIGSVEVSSLFGESSLFKNLPIGGEGVSFSDYIRQLQVSTSEYADDVFGVLSNIFGGVMSFVLVIVISFYLAVRKNGIEEFIKVVTPFNHQDYAIGLWHRTKTKIGKWIQGQLLLMLIVGVLTYIGLFLLGMPNAFALAVLAGLFEIIPLFGAILAAIPAIAIGYLEFGLTMALMVTGLYIIVQQLESQLIYPLVVHKIVGVPALLVLLSLLIGGRLAGFIGIILSVPIAALVMEFVRDIESRNKALAEASRVEKVE